MGKKCCGNTNDTTLECVCDELTCTGSCGCNCKESGEGTLYGVGDVQSSVESPEWSPTDVKMINDIFGDMDMETGDDVGGQDDLTDEQVAWLKGIFKK